MFRLPRPRLNQPSALTSEFQQTATTRSAKGLQTWSKSILDAGLPASDQGDGKDVGFFDQALLLFGFSTLSVVAGSVYLVTRWLRR